MMLGISSFTYGWSVGVPHQMPEHPMSVFDLVGRAIDLGATCLQIGDNLPLHSLQDADRRALKALLTDHNIRLEVGARGLTEHHLMHYIDIAAYYGSPLLRFVVDGKRYEPSPDTIVKIIRGALSELHDARVTLGIENHDRFKASELSAVLNAVDDAAVGICLDTVNSLGAGEALGQVAGELARHTVNLHIKDFVIRRVPHNMGFQVTGAPAGQGMLSIPALLDQLVPYDRCQSAVLEQWVTPEDSLTETIRKEERWAFESMQYLRRLPHFLNSTATAEDYDKT